MPHDVVIAVELLADSRGHGHALADECLRHGLVLEPRNTLLCLAKAGLFAGLGLDRQIAIVAAFEFGDDAAQRLRGRGLDERGRGEESEYRCDDLFEHLNFLVKLRIAVLL